MKKTKIFKKITLGGLAVVMAGAGIFAFAPIGANANTSKNDNTNFTLLKGELITPKADDPVIYTTESGLEIKYGNAPSINESMGSGNLAGYPYFTTKNNTTGITYTWVIIGRSESITDTQRFLFSDWKNTNKDFYKYMAYFFGNVAETTSPAGQLIDSTISSKTYVYDTLKNTKPKMSSEIPEGCVLAYANGVLELQPFCQNEKTGNAAGETGYFLNYVSDTFGGSTNKVTEIMNYYYNRDNFGFGTNLSLLQNTTLTQSVTYWESGNVRETTSCSLHFFPLDYNETYSNFRYQTYLTNTQVKASLNFWVRSNTTAEAANVINTSGEVVTYRPYYYSVGEKQGIRPACVLKIF